MTNLLRYETRANLTDIHNHKQQPVLLSPVLPLRMVSSGLLRRVALVRTDVSEEHSASFIKVTRIGELGTTLALTSNRRTLRRNVFLRFLIVTIRVVPSSQISVTLMMEALSSSETSVLTRATRRKISEGAILQYLCSITIQMLHNWWSAQNAYNLEEGQDSAQLSCGRYGCVDRMGGRSANEIYGPRPKEDNILCNAAS
jgi:hypothetical protein